MTTSEGGIVSGLDSSYLRRRFNIHLWMHQEVNSQTMAFGSVVEAMQ